MKIRYYLIIFIIFLLVATFGLMAWFNHAGIHFIHKDPIKIGILHSLTGYLASTEKPAVDGALLAIEEINQAGGVMGRMLEPIIVDGKSNEIEFEKATQKLTQEDKVPVIFGLYSSSCRKQLLPVLEKSNCLLFYPSAYAGLEESDHVIYSGGTANQNVLPAVTWCLKNLGKRMYFVGSDYIYPQTIFEVIKNQAHMLGAEIIGSGFVALGKTDFSSIIEEIKTLKPDCILNCVVGSSCASFFTQLRAAQITSKSIPIMSFDVSEEEVLEIGIQNTVGSYAVGNYFQSIKRSKNKAFVERFKRKYGKEKVVNNYVVTEYNSIYLWAQAVKKCKSLDYKVVCNQLFKEIYSGHSAMLYVDKNHHVWRKAFIGQVQYDGQFKIIWDSYKSLPPIPYPPYKTKKEWDEFVHKLYVEWGNKWSK